ncbi:MAG: hypothetical protein ACOC80_06710 [Petrotogales bacterium]
MNKEEVKTDALGNEIVIGNLYGYANNKSGINSVWIGRAKKITKNGVTLGIIQHKTGAYDRLEEAKDTRFRKVAKSVNVKSIMLFPVSEFYLGKNPHDRYEIVKNNGQDYPCIWDKDSNFPVDVKSLIINAVDLLNKGMSKDS